VFIGKKNDMIFPVPVIPGNRKAKFWVGGFELSGPSCDGITIEICSCVWIYQSENVKNKLNCWFLLQKNLHTGISFSTVILRICL
jgi:hypothetical protein